MPTRIRTVGRAPPPGVIPELQGASDLQIADMCVTGTFDHGRTREVCIAELSEVSGGTTVKYRRTVREHAADGGATVCAVSSEGTATCTRNQVNATAVRRGRSVIAEECVQGEPLSP
jgi:hypothetical protein